MSTLIIPGSWKCKTVKQTEFTVEADTILGVLHAFVSEFPELWWRIFADEERTSLLGYNKIALNGKMIATKEAGVKEVTNTDKIMILPPLAGG
jgi:molybdopterin converting factor small subunit